MTFHPEGKATLILVFLTGGALAAALHWLIPGWVEPR